MKKTVNMTSATTRPRVTRRLLRLEEAATYLSCSPTQIRQLIDCGLPILLYGDDTSDGRNARVDLRDLDKVIEKCKRQSDVFGSNPFDGFFRFEET